MNSIWPGNVSRDAGATMALVMPFRRVTGINSDSAWKASATAVEVLGKDPAELTSGDRSVAKMINFGIVYGISAYGLSENLEIPREQAQQYIDAYLARFPLVQDFIERTIEQAKRDGVTFIDYVPSQPGLAECRIAVVDLHSGNRGSLFIPSVHGT